ncbi:MAG TPA: hypothetical protein VHE35_18160 [Kofleriaceae bacterium]|nr:hypothetical protein [Kofleriaceae bacterium]
MADELKQGLVEFLNELGRAQLEVYLGGGYGLYLRQLSLLDSDVRTYLPREAWPRPRATADLDVFLPTELVIEHTSMVRVRQVLDQLRYRPVPGHEYLHFARNDGAGEVRIELLTGPVTPDLHDKVKVRDLRVRPRKTVQLHAYLTEEAIDLERKPIELTVDGTIVRIPNSFSFVLMKLHAFRDRMEQVRDEEDRQLGRHHALDVYRLIAMLTEEEESFVRGRHDARRDSAPVRAAAGVVAQYFSGPTALGVLRLREHSLAGDHLDIPGFLEMLGDLFGGESGPPDGGEGARRP